MTQRPRDLTRQDLPNSTGPRCRQLHRGNLQTAWRETKNEDIAATIVGYIRHVTAARHSFPTRASPGRDEAILASRPWTEPQRKWLERIGKQLEDETVVDREALDAASSRPRAGSIVSTRSSTASWSRSSARSPTRCGRSQRELFTEGVLQMFDRVVSNPAILGGKPVIKGTRISVELILEWIAV